MRSVLSLCTWLFGLAFCALNLTVGLGSAQTAKESSPEVRQKTFEMVWNTVNENFFDPEFGGVDWAKMREKYEPQVAKVKTDDELYELLNKMLGELHVSHIGVFRTENALKFFKVPEATTGFVVKDIDKQVVIRRIIKGSAAAKAGLRVGFIIKKIDDETVSNSLEASYKLAGDQRQYRIVFLDEHDNLKETVFSKQPLPGKSLRKTEGREYNEWSTFLEFERLAQGIGYIHFTNFYTDLDKKLRSAIKSLKGAPGIILDLRGNGGGGDDVALKLAGLLLDKKTLLAISKTRQGDRYSYIAEPDSDPYLGPVVILVDEDSYSQAEQISASLQDVGRAIVIGKRTPGKDMDGVLVELPTSAGLMYPVGQPRTPKGVVVEGRGVIPDIEVSLSRADLLKGKDSQLEAAINYIKNGRAPSSTK
jgi:carboxyl-terminal processing protease